jgi:hypothetical protein
MDFPLLAPVKYIILVYKESAGHFEFTNLLANHPKQTICQEKKWLVQIAHRQSGVGPDAIKQFQWCTQN